jgi:hypothetical protein
MSRRLKSKSLIRRLLFTGLVTATILCVSLYGCFWYFVMGTPEYQWKQAGNAVAAQQWELAEVHLRKVSQAAPENIPARMTLVSALQQKQQAGLSPVELALRERDGRWRLPEGATEQLVEVARLAPDHFQARKLLLKGWRAEGRHEAAAQTARELYELVDREFQTLYLVAHDDIRQGNWDSAESLTNELVSRTQQVDSPLPLLRMLA